MPTLLPNGTLVFNVTPHDLHFGFGEGDALEIVTAPSDGTLNARPKSNEVLRNSRYSLVTVDFAPVPGGLELIKRIRSQSADALIVGSIIAAQAYPGEVVATVPLRGGRLRKDWIVRADRFTTFQTTKEMVNHG